MERIKQLIRVISNIQADIKIGDRRQIHPLLSYLILILGAA